MSDIAIRAERLGKSYRISHQSSKRYQTLQEDLVSFLRRPFAGAAESTETFWALKDISLEVRQGEVLGIIGRNGAGKSTLLKILSRITRPTTGYADIFGRVGSLLEVGTGFHPELTGRENIYLNGAVLGMRRSEIERKFDEIVAFAEIEQFLDTPAKRYSSGMYMRLAFAVAAHLEPEILMVDEVLAVGDAAFQRKALGKMGDVTKQGRTVLFVSHNMAAIASLCSRALWLSSGKVAGVGPVSEVVQQYMESIVSTDATPLMQRKDRGGDQSVHMISVKIDGTSSDKAVRSTSGLDISISYESPVPVRYPKVLIGLYDYTNTGVYLFDSDAVEGLPEEIPASGTIRCKTGPINMTPGQCYVNIAFLKGPAMADYVQFADEFTVEAEDFYGTGKIPPRDWVLCLTHHEWSVGD